MGTVHPFPGSKPTQIGFERAELSRIVDLYGRMVAAGLWKDYAIQFGKDAASFWAFRRAAEQPEVRIEKRPALRGRQGMWALIGENGAVLKRGHELGPVLAPIERRLLKVVNE
ncbi:MAG TPA: DUF2794 domain-containing protein [Allosphingosinicella sp.]|jgi:hypothetical protein|uniref:DUF2794 domain-containing protein n=1 Tax=Allosphingosinicella sp. TaxID=2823234 RepID=UPI002F29F3A9